jgi:hypothetical protein
MKSLRGLMGAVACVCGAAACAGIIAPELQAMIDQSPNATVDVVFWVKAEPPFKVAAGIKAEYADRLKHLGNEVKSYSRTAQVRPLTAVEIANRRVAKLLIDQTHDERGMRINEALRLSAAPNIDTIANAIEGEGGVARDPSYILASVRGYVPAASVRALAAHPLVNYVDIHFVGGPLLDNQRHSLGVTGTGFWSNGFTGGIYDVGLIDTGVQRNHTAFTGFNWEGVITDPDGHGTGVCGMMVSKNGTYRGLAYELHTVCAADAETGMRVSTDWLLTQTVQRPEAINVSWGGQSPDPEEYGTGEQWYDSAADSFDVTFGQAAGNEGGSGYTSMVSPAKAYNTIAVANVFDNNTIVRTDDYITASSSRGPTPGGRKKPDIAAPGHETMSTTRTLGYGNLGGTSSAAPKVTAGAILLRDFGTTSSLEDKAVLINSADSWSDNNTVESGDDGPVNFGHWSRSYGWGYLDLFAAYQQAPYVILDSFPRPLVQGARRLAYYTGAREDGFKATLTWNRHTSAYDGIEFPTEVHSLTNFNLGLYNASTGNLIHGSNSAIDNVEQVWSNSIGIGVLKVHTTGNWDTDVQTESYALSVPSTFTQRTPPSYDVTVSVPQYAVVGSEISVSGTVTNTGQLFSYNTLADCSAHVVGGPNPAQIGTLNPSETANVHWDAEVNQSPGPQEIDIDVEATCYGETFRGTASQTITVLPFYLAPSAYTRVRGSHVTGDLSSVTTSNNQYLSHEPGVVLTSQQWPVELHFRATSPVALPRFFHARVEASATSASIRQKVDVWNFATGAWVELSSQNLATADSTRILTPGGTLSDYVQPGSREVRIRVMAKAFGPVLLYPWVHRLDQVGWHIDD